jgi:minor extracellular serine protease Vpr
LALASAAAPVRTTFALDETGSAPNLWFVEMPHGPTADGTGLSTVQADQTTFKSDAKKAGLTFQQRFSYTKLFNGLAIKTDAGTADEISSLASVQNVYPIGIETLPPDQPISPDDASANQMTGADIAQSELGLTGAGVKVGIIDTGIDYDHPDLGGDGVQRSNSSVFPTPRVIAGYDFVGDAYDAGNPNSDTPVPDNYPDDCAGHGTHVAGIVGANGAVTGVAPGVKFGDYRVFGCAGSTSDDVMLAALERAYSDGMQVVNMSIGSAFENWPQYPTAQASDRLQNKGVVVVSSIGNSGASGLYSAGAPGVSAKGIGVASFDNTFQQLPAFSVSPDGGLFPYNTAAAAPAPPTSGTFTLARTGTTASTSDACSALPAGSLSGMVVLIRRGGCTFYIKSKNAQNAGAAGVILYNNTAGLVSPTVAGSPPIIIPVVAVSDTDGATIDGRIAADPATTMTWTDQLTSSPVPTGGTISSFSSFGTAADLSLKPDIGAPGGLIRSTYPIELGSYTTLSGTSMASPHVAGAVALLLQAKPNTPANAVRSILQNSADPAVRFGTSAFDNTYRQGAGLLDIPGAILATTRIEPGKLAFGESAQGPVTQTLTVTNKGASAVTYDLSNANALSTGPNTFLPTFPTASNNVSFTVAGLPATSVMVPAGGAATVAVTASPDPALADRSLYGGYVVFTPEGGGDVYRVPYAGFKGDYQSIQVLTLTPLLCKGNPCASQSSGATYTLTGPDFPYLAVHLNHQARRIRADVFRTSDNKSFGTAFNMQYLPRNSTATARFNFIWDGTAAKGAPSKVSDVPNGTYYLRVTVTKALGTDTETETWTSPPITLARP